MRRAVEGSSPISAATVDAVTLVEVFADRTNGHWGDNLIRLAKGGSFGGCAVTVVAVQGVHEEIRRGLESTGARLVDRPVGGAARSCLWVSRRLNLVQGLIRRAHPGGTLWAQVRYLQRCLVEVAALLTADVVVGRAQPAVILSASPALAATTATLSRSPHVRFVHFLTAPEGRALRALERLCRAGEHQVVVICTNESIERGLLQRHPNLRTLVRRFTVADPGMRVADSERAAARRHLGVDDTEFVVAMPGGWWPNKDVDTVKAAIARMSRPVTLIVSGKPITPTSLEPSARQAGGRILALEGGITETQLRRIYAASDCALVARTPGWNEEVGALYDAARYGVPLVMSDHDPVLSSTLRDEPWARLFPPGDSEALAATLEAVHDTPPPRPDRDAPSRLGLSRGDERTAELAGIATLLLSSENGASRSTDREART